QFRVQVQALARLNRHFFLAFAWHKVAPWPSVYASHTKVRIGSRVELRRPHIAEHWPAMFGHNRSVDFDVQIVDDLRMGLWPLPVAKPYEVPSQT
ncbi:hypothetical protein KDX20_33015, partial [Burkholderia cenocepacia]|uniref:hypothetical protein n=1 Tax=Burkholderia cenocepacia TaxID=95486 RepID=UPI001B8F35F5